MAEMASAAGGLQTRTNHRLAEGLHETDVFLDVPRQVAAAPAVDDDDVGDSMHLAFSTVNTAASGALGSFQRCQHFLQGAQ